MNVREICAALDTFAPPALAYSWDRIGLVIGSEDWPVDRVLTALTVTDAAVDEALKRKAGLIVCHHTPIWEPLRRLRIDDPITARCLRLIENRVAVFTAHTNLDIAPGGVNDALADALSIVDRAPLATIPHAGLVKLVTFVPESHLAAVREAICRAGAGVIGNYTYCTYSSTGVGTFVPGVSSSPFSGAKQVLNEEPEHRLETVVPVIRMAAVTTALKKAHPYEEVAYDWVVLNNRDASIGIGVYGLVRKTCCLADFAEYVRVALKLPHVRFAGDPKRPIHSVGVLGGSAGSVLGEMSYMPDVLVTGELGYHETLTALEQGMTVIEGGHDGSEKIVVPLLAHFLRKSFKTVKIYPFQEAEVYRVVGS